MYRIKDILNKSTVNEIYRRFGRKTFTPEKLSKEEVQKLQEFRKRKKLLKKIYKLYTEV